MELPALLIRVTGWYPGRMSTDEKETTTETSDSELPIEIYTDERIAEFLAEDELTPQQKKRLEEKLRQPKRRKS
jgi:hypothetical protein